MIPAPDPGGGGHGRRGAVLLPAFLDLRGRRCVVVGGGRVALRKVRALLEAGADVVLVCPEAVTELEDLAARGRVTWRRRPYRRGDLAGAWLAFAATGREEVDGRVLAEAAARRIFANPASRPAGREEPGGGTFFLPACRRRGRVAVAVGTEGGSPALAAVLAERAAAVVLPEHVILADLLAGLRGEVGRSLPASERRRFWRWAVADGTTLDLLATGRRPEAEARLRAELARRAGTTAGVSEG